MKYIYNRVRLLIYYKNTRQLNMKFILGLIIGAALGFLYYLLTNFAENPPIVASSPWFSILYGVMLGGFITRN
ncbi:MAG: hypothetical protein KA792_05165 [Bacteroidales bacterium]|nr:hypothetical protein [Bacteroidales bacterium]